MAPERDNDPQRRVADILEGRFAEKQRLGARGRHDADILLIRSNEHTDAAGVRSAHQHRARGGQKARQHVNHCGRERKALFVVALADDQQVVAPIDRPHAVGVQVGQTRPGRLLACARGL